MIARFPYSPTKFPPIPAVFIDLMSPDGTKAIPDVSAWIDTAADRTVIPERVAHELELRPIRQLPVQGLGGVEHLLNVYALDIRIPGVALISTRAVAHPDEPHVLIGRDILNLFRVTFDGPNQLVEFH